MGKWYLGLVGVLVALLSYGARTLAQAPPAPATQPALVEQASRLIAEARQSYQTIQDYSCTFIKRERINNEMHPENVIAMRVRTQPFSVYFRWAAPRAIEGQEACYVAGRYNDMMRVHPVGILGVVGWVTVDPRDARAMKDNRHAITEAGIGNLIERISNGWERDKGIINAQLQIDDYEYNKRPCTRVEVSHPNTPAGSFYAYRCVVYWDKETHLPIRYEAYDWPRQGGDTKGELLEIFNYVNLRLNVGLSDAVFNH
jgi:hypothetical protein